MKEIILMKRNYIAFGLWGDKKVFTKGAIRNAMLAKQMYHDWKVIVYYDNTVPVDVLYKLKDLDVILVDMTGSQIYAPFWHFLAADLPDAGYTIFHHADSSLPMRRPNAEKQLERTRLWSGIWEMLALPLKDITYLWEGDSEFS